MKFKRNVLSYYCASSFLSTLVFVLIIVILSSSVLLLFYYFEINESIDKIDERLNRNTRSIIDSILSKNEYLTVQSKESINLFNDNEESTELITGNWGCFIYANFKITYKHCNKTTAFLYGLLLIFMATPAYIYLVKRTNYL